MVNGLQIEPNELAIVQHILQQRVPNLSVWAYGSRVKGTAKTYSDLDLAIITQTPLTFLQLAELEEAFSNSALAWKVDLLDWASANETFKNIVRKQYIVIQ
ncbi:DNA polymerase beta subunit [Pasteurellaceae bacterium Orientalotternb1]|nr:DNA polymerase beta subunit [Pasteurellaceae bacterium Orientalotternb1]